MESMVEESEKDDFYWTDEKASTSKFLDDDDDSNIRTNNLWDGLFSPEDGPTKFFELKNDFDKQLTINETETEDRNLNKDEKAKTTLNGLNNEISDSKMHSHQNSSKHEFSPAKEHSISSHHSQSSSNKLTNFNNSTVSTCTRDSSNSLDDSQTASEMTVHLDYARLKSEHRKLKKYFENAYENRYKKPPISETIRRISRCENVTLDFYRSKKEKMDLLDAALELDDWDVVVTVVLFLKRSVDNSIFRQCLLEKPAAAKHYLNYLNESGDKQELLDTLYGLGRIADASMLEFEQACSLTDPKRKLDALKHCLQSGFHHPDLANEKKHLEEWINLLETHTKPH